MGSKGYRVSFFRDFADRLSDITTYVVDCIYFAHRYDRRVVEVPVTCRDLRQSKFNLPKEALDKYSHLVSLWWKDLAEAESSFEAKKVKELLVGKVVQPRP